MSDEILSSLVNDVVQISKNIDNTKKYIEVLKNAGENTAEIDGKLRNLEIRRDRWKKSLEASGYTVPIK